MQSMEKIKPQTKEEVTSKAKEHEISWNILPCLLRESSLALQGTQKMGSLLQSQD